ncbi:MAG TPA: MmgE/PrpD family protein [bacterium]|nr:MmgE/PrpD family protein [bacterium]
MDPYLRGPDLNQSPAEATGRLAAFAVSLSWSDVPEAVRRRTKIALLDVLGAAIAGSRMPIAGIASDIAPKVWGGDEASILLSGRRASAAGAAFANGCLANALDIDDGYRPIKGHPGAVVFPAALAAAESLGRDGATLLAAVVAGYEVAIRAGLALHAVYADYHGSGSWGALGAAAAAGRVLGLPAERLTHALGIAEYHGPMSPIMRCVEHPAMVKDGIGWGAMAGLGAALLAGSGFTGIPTVLDLRPAFLSDLGREYKIMQLYFKPHACCRWAQPPIEGVRRILERIRLAPEVVEKIRIHTFEAAMHLGPVWPRTTEEAQYSLAWPVAAALIDGRVGPEQVSGARLGDARVRALASKVEPVLSAELDGRFPAEALCEVEILMRDGTVHRSGICGAKGDPADPLTDAALRRKFHDLADPVLGLERAVRVEQLVDELDRLAGIEDLLALLRFPVTHQPQVTGARDRRYGIRREGVGR